MLTQLSLKYLRLFFAIIAIFYIAMIFASAVDCSPLIFKKIEIIKNSEAIAKAGLNPLHGKYALADTKVLYEGHYWIFSRKNLGMNSYFISDHTLMGYHRSQFLNCIPYKNFNPQNFLISLVEEEHFKGLNEAMRANILKASSDPKFYLNVRDLKLIK